MEEPAENTATEETMSSKAKAKAQSALKELIAVPHPISCVFHLFFKLLAIVSYILLNLFVDSFVLVFIVVLLCMACDFWTVKNVTGRLMVGLRWWNDVKEDGTSEWIYESLEGQRKINTTEAILFWSCLLGFPLVWAFFAIVSLVELQPLWLASTFVALVISCPNIFGYLMCAKESRKKLHDMAKSYASDTAKEITTKAVSEYAKNAFSFGK